MNVWRLIRKDLSLQAGFLGLLLAFEIASIAVLVPQLPEAPGVAFMMMHGLGLVGGFILCFRTMVAEEKNRALLFLKTLPVSTHEIVLAKFGANILLVGANIGILYFGYEISRLAGLLPGAQALTLTAILVGLAAQWFNNTFFLTVAFLFDSEKAVFVPFPLVFVMINVLINLNQLRGRWPLETIFDVFNRHTWLGFLVVVAFITLMSRLATWSMSRKKVFG